MISILFTVKNGGDYFKAAIDSLAKQTFSQFECLVIDDGSTDNALQYLTELNDSRFVLLVNQGNGIVDALNTGLEKASGEFIARMDADDISLPQRLEKQLNYLTINKGVDFCGCKIEYFSENKSIEKGLQLYEAWINSLETHIQIETHMFVECAIPHPSFMIRRSLIDNIGDYQDNGWAEDYDLVLRAYMHGCRFGKPKDVLLHWRDHSERLSLNDERYKKTAFIQAKVYYLNKSFVMKNAIDSNKKIIIWGAAKTGKLISKNLLDLGVPINGFVDVSQKLIGKDIQGTPIYDAMQFNFTDCLVLLAVGTRGVRTMIEEHLALITPKPNAIALC